MCKVLDFGVALEQLSDNYNHVIEKGEKYIKVQYFQKDQEFKSKVRYKLLMDEVYVYPNLVMSLLVNLKDDLTLLIEEYQWLMDSI